MVEFKVKIVKGIGNLPEKAKKEYRINFGTRLIEDDTMEYFLFYHGSHLIGFICGYWDNYEFPGYYYIDHFYVVTDKQGKGYGRKIMNWMGYHFRKIVLAPAVGVNGFYKKLGFRYPKNNYVEMKKNYRFKV